MMRNIIQQIVVEAIAGTKDLTMAIDELCNLVNNNESKWILTNDERPVIGSNIEYSENGITIEGTMDYSDSRTCMMAGIAGGHGYFGEGFATDGENGCDKGLICDDPKYWRYYED